MTNNSIDNLRQTITDKIINQLETCQVENYKKPWFCIGQLPSNAVTKNTYHGINTLWLGLSGFSRLEFATYKQWQSIDAQVQKGQKGYPVVFYKQLEITDKESDEKKSIPMLRYSTVFNCSQVDNYEPEPLKLNDNDSIDHIDQFVNNCHIDTKHGFDRACFAPSQNEVHIPEIGQFDNTDGYYSVLFHEYTHATGHKTRLDRDQKGRFGGEEYAFEELIAELGSAFTMAYLGLEFSPREDHAIYIKSWLQALKSDNKFIFSAAAKAQAGIDYLVTQQEKRAAA